MWDLKYVDGDFTFDDANRFAIVDGTDRIKQDLEHALMCVQDSDQLNPDFGVDWQKIKGVPFNRTLIEYELRRVLSAHDDVDTIGAITISSPDATRHIDIEVLITLVSGETVQVEVSV